MRFSLRFGLGFSLRFGHGLVWFDIFKPYSLDKALVTAIWTLSSVRFSIIVSLYSQRSEKIIMKF